MRKAKAVHIIANAGYAASPATITPEILAAALRSYRAAKAQFMMSDEAASRMIAEAVLAAATIQAAS
jgi:uncharacterized protein (DUF362 family)